MNRANLINRLVARKMNTQGKGKAACVWAGRTFCGYTRQSEAQRKN